MKVRYVGPYLAVDLPLPMGGFLTVERGGVASVMDDHGASLLEQRANWELADSGQRAPAQPKAVQPPKEEEDE